MAKKKSHKRKMVWVHGFVHLGEKIHYRGRKYLKRKRRQAAKLLIG